MVRVRLLQILTRSFVLIFLSGPTDGQMRRRGQERVAVAGWSDDTHFILRTFDENKNSVLGKVGMKLTVSGHIIFSEKNIDFIL